MGELEDVFDGCKNVEEAVMVAIGGAMALGAQGAAGLLPERIQLQRAEVLGQELSRWLQSRGIEDGSEQPDSGGGGDHESRAAGLS